MIYLLTKKEIMEIIYSNQEIIATGLMFITAYLIIVCGFWLVKIVIGE